MEPLPLIPLSFAEISGWEADDHLAALKCFAVSARRMETHPHSTKQLGTSAEALRAAGHAALRLLSTAEADRDVARRFFETGFVPMRASGADSQGFVTGYFEPVVQASAYRTERFSWPLLRRPSDLVDLDRDPHEAASARNLPEGFRFARDTGTGLSEYWDRQEIENGALAERGLEFAWLEDPVDAFFIHIQGSACLKMQDGNSKRISYAGKSGHPYTSIGKLLADEGILPRETITMQVLRQWLIDNRSAGRQLMQRNRSYIFFAETSADTMADGDAIGPVAAGGVPLTPGRSLAVDHRLHTFSTPVWLSLKERLPAQDRDFARLMIAQDTGSAIVGPSRGDIFTGSGNAAGELAGVIRHRTDFIFLVPRIDGLEH